MTDPSTPLPICSSTTEEEMTKIPCAFDGNIHRIDICQGVAVVFFKTAKGTVWPLCQACSDRHKEMMVQLVEDRRIEVPTAVGAMFDIPLTDEETLETWKQQDPQRVQRVIDLADAAFLRRTP